MSDPERIWLQSYEDTTALGEDRLWCEDKVWPANDEDHEPTEYIRADRISQQDAELDRLRRHIELLQEKDASQCACSIDTPDDVCLFHVRMKAEARKAAFIEAAEIAEKVAAGQDQEWRTDTAMRVAYAIRAKAEETRT